jgi:Na+-driven multidrug efflux pump
LAGARPIAGVYWTLAVAGTLLPLLSFAPWLGVYGFNPTQFLVDMFANRVSSFFALDVIVSAVVLTLFVVVQGSRDGVRPLWLPIVATFLVGVSCGLPLFLALREQALNSRSPRPGA